MAFYQLNAKSDQRLNDFKVLGDEYSACGVTRAGTLIFLSSFTVTSELSASPGRRCAATKTKVAEVFVVAGSGFERPTVEVIKIKSSHGHLQNSA